MAPIINSLGLVSGVLGIVSFFQSNIPAKKTKGATVQIKAGLGNDRSSGLHGKVAHVYAYDYNNNYLGQSDNCVINYDGGACKTTVNQAGPNIQADYISITNQNDATCIAWVSVRQYDGTAGGAWTGDISRGCGHAWYHGNQQAGQFKNGGSWRPACGWFDGDHTNGYKFAAMKFTVRAYGELSSRTQNQNHQCSATIYNQNKGPINRRPAGPNRKRSSLDPIPRDVGVVGDRLPWMKTRLIKSNLPGQSAEDLCSSPTSWGPDFVDEEGNFCDMETHTLHPACSLGNLLGCVDLVVNGTEAAVIGGLDKTYDVLSTWDE